MLDKYSALTIGLTLITIGGLGLYETLAESPSKVETNTEIPPTMQTAGAPSEPLRNMNPLHPLLTFYTDQLYAWVDHNIQWSFDKSWQAPGARIASAETLLHFWCWNWLLFNSHLGCSCLSMLTLPTLELKMTRCIDLHSISQVWTYSVIVKMFVAPQWLQSIFIASPDC